MGLETVLAQAGIIFQYYSDIFVLSYLSRTLEVDQQHYRFRKIKNSILTCDAGLTNTGTYMIATPERALLDVIYLNTSYYFDNLSSINWDTAYQILPIYCGHKRLQNTVDNLYKNHTHAAR